MIEKKTNGKPKRCAFTQVQRLWTNLSAPRLGAEVNQPSSWQKVLLLVGFSLVAAMMVFPRPQAPHTKYQVGDIAERDIKASADFLVEDQESTAKRQQEQLEDSPLVFDLDERIGAEVNARLHQAFEFMRQTIQENQPPAMTDEGAVAGAETKSSFTKLYKVLQEKKPEFDRMLGVTLANNIFYLLARNYFSVQWEDIISQQVNLVLSQGVFGEQSLSASDLQRPLIIRRLPSWQEKEETAPGRFLNLLEAKKKVNAYCRDAVEDLPSGVRWAICEIAQALVIPNISLNRAETEKRKQARLRESRPVYFQIKKGEMLVREGEKITQTHLVKLHALDKERPQGWWFWNFLGTWGLIILLGGFCAKLLGVNAKKGPRTLKEYGFLAV
ncbi:MAG: hypothetical protein ACUVRZ_09480, partial [Desulfobacca sp.]|uniref:hypothetical protein n=1 Tax=Desulfobacca sp. TaxID=2067990 RepID=UPI00404AD268